MYHGLKSQNLGQVTLSNWVNEPKILFETSDLSNWNMLAQWIQENATDKKIQINLRNVSSSIIKFIPFYLPQI